MVAYLVGEYRKVTHAFIHREVAELRRQGMMVHTFTIRDACDFPDHSHLSDQPKTEVVINFDPVILFSAQWYWLARSPRKYFEALRQAWHLGWPGWRGRVYPFLYFLEATLFARRCHELGITNVHNHFGDAAGDVALLASKLNQIPFSLTIHGPDVFLESKKWRLDLKGKEASFISGISHFTRSQIMLHCNETDWPKVHVVRAGLDLLTFSADFSRKPSQTLELLFVGRLVPAKGLGVLLSAMGNLQGNLPCRLTLIATGSHEEKDALRNQIIRAGLSQVVFLLGSQTPGQLRQRMRSSDVLISPSFAEGLPQVIVEAMALGLPVIATPVGATSELVRDKITGLLVPPGDSAALIAAIQAFANDPDSARTRAQTARLEIERDYDQTQECAKLKHFFEASLL